MVTIGRTRTGLWHVLGEYTCQDTSRAVLDETKPLDEFEFRAETQSEFVDVSSAEEIRRGIDEAFCKRCRKTVNHWLGQREVYLAEKTDGARRVDESDFARVDDSSRTCPYCGKPESAEWNYERNDEVVCSTCRRALVEGYTGDGVSIGQFKSGMMNALVEGQTESEPVEAPDWYRERQRRENPERQRDRGINEMAEITGISRHTASRIYRQEIHSVAELADAEMDVLTEVGGIGETRGKQLIRKARRKLARE